MFCREQFSRDRFWGRDVEMDDWDVLRNEPVLLNGL